MGNGIDQIITPEQVLPDGISVIISDTLLTEPVFYTIKVVKSTKPSIPTIPITPWDQESNPVLFTVYEAQFIFLPITSK
jgi:hypothetical protein